MQPGEVWLTISASVNLNFQKVFVINHWWIGPINNWKRLRLLLMAPPPLPVNLPCHLPAKNVTGGCRKKKQNEITRQETACWADISVTDGCLFCKSFNPRRAFNSARRVAEEDLLKTRWRSVWIIDPRGETHLFSPHRNHFKEEINRSLSVMTARNQFSGAWTWCDFYAHIKRMTRERASGGARLTSWFLKFIFLPSYFPAACYHPNFIVFVALWGAGGGEERETELNMREPLGHQGALAGAPQSVWIWLDFLFFGLRGWQVTRNQLWLKAERNSSRTLRSTYPDPVSSTRLRQTCPVTASGCGGLS